MCSPVLFPCDSNAVGLTAAWSGYHYPLQGAREKQLEHLLVQAVEELQRMHQRVQLQVHEPQHDPKLQALLSDPKYLQTDLALHPPAETLGEGVLGKT